VRINPHHVHIKDSKYYDEIYTSISRPRNKDPWYSIAWDKAVPFNSSTFQTLDEEWHRQRRAPISQFFSKRSIRNLEPMIQANVKKLTERIHGEHVAGTVLNLSNAYSALALDVISSYCFGIPEQALDQPEYGRVMRETLNDGVQVNQFGRQFPALYAIMVKMPPWLLEKIDPVQGTTNKTWNRLNDKIMTVINGDDDAATKAAYPTIFHHLVNSDLPASEKTPHRLLGEAMNFIGAGTETTGRTLSTTAFFIINNPPVREKLMEELLRTIPSPQATASLLDLETLPYLVRQIFHLFSSATLTLT
jgi:cytochrome P450